jgi:diaminopimelate epimerase
MSADRQKTALHNSDDVRDQGRAFIKMHGLRNHFVIIDGRQAAYTPGRADIVRICDPQVGVGGDQLVVIETADSRADAFMRLFNVDGREVEACGNATRCVAWLLLEEKGVDRIQLETLAGVLDCHRVGDRQVACDMGRISMLWSDVPLSEECDTLGLDLAAGPLQTPSALSVGNPHAVFFVDSLETIDLAALAPAIQQNPLFPQQVNVGVAELLDKRHIRLMVYERGAGLTQACGSGACAAAFAARARQLTAEKRITVTLPAGNVIIEIRDNDHAIMTGPVDFCFSGRL